VQTAMMSAGSKAAILALSYPWLCSNLAKINNIFGNEKRMRSVKNACRTHRFKRISCVFIA
jgi:hypothetical protein